MKYKIVPTNHQTLRDIVVSQSEYVDDDNDVSSQWRIISYEYCYPSTVVCGCGRKGVRNIFMIENIHNAKQILIGDSCVDKLFGKRYDLLINYLKRIVRTREWVPSKYMIDYSVKEGYLDESDADIIKRYISQRLRPSGKLIVDEVKISVNKLINSLQLRERLDKKVVDKVHRNMSSV